MRSIVKQSRIQKFRVKATQLEDTQWEALLQSVLLRKPLGGDVAVANGFEKLEVTANIHDENLVIIFRNNIAGITQRLGEISLRKDEVREIDSISWAATAVTWSVDLEKEVRDLRAKYEEQGRTIEKLNQQLDNLIQAKIEHENSLLEKFQELLNAKKSKIRDLHRALARVKEDPQNGKILCVDSRTAITKPLFTAAQVKTAQEISSPGSPAASRSTKRKAKGTRPTATASVSTSDEEEAFDKMSVDGKHERDREFTPELSDPDPTEDEDDDDLDSGPVFSQPVENETVTKSRDEPAAKVPARRPTPPPRRELPFPAPPRQPTVEEENMANKTEPASGSQATNNTSATVDGNDGDDDDDETSDDEL